MRVWGLLFIILLAYFGTSIAISNLRAPCQGEIIYKNLNNFETSNELVIREGFEDLFTEYNEGELIQGHEKFKVERTENLVVYTHCDRSISEASKTISPEELEKILKEVEEILGLSAKKPVKVYLLSGAEDFFFEANLYATAIAVSGYNEVYLPLSGDAAHHEFAHLLLPIDSLPFFTEGAAEYVEHVRSGKSSGIYPCKVSKETITSEAILYNSSFRDSAGSLTAYLINTYGLENYKRFIKTIHMGYSYESIDYRFQQVYGFPLQDALDDWSSTQDFGDRAC